MFWIFPKVRKLFFENYRVILRLMFSFISQELKRLKSQHFAKCS